MRHPNNAIKTEKTQQKDMEYMTHKITKLFIASGFLFVMLVTAAQAAFEDANIDWRMAEGESIKVFVPTHPYMDSLKPLIPEFEQLTGIKVVLEEGSEQQFLNKLLLDLSSGKPNTDAFMALHNRIAQYATGGWIEGLNSYIENVYLELSGSCRDMAKGFHRDKLHGNPKILSYQLIPESPRNRAGRGFSYGRTPGSVCG